MKIAFYARVSKPPKGQFSEQQKRDQNPEVQLMPLREWAKSNRHTVVEEYVDRQTGKNAERPQLKKLMRDIAKGLRDIDAVVVWKLDRFARSNQDLHNLVAELRAEDVAFISLKEHFDLTTSVGKLMFDILGAFAEFERNVIVERTKAGLAFARAEGRIPGPKIDPKKGPCRMTVWRQRRRELKTA
jgi:DNA invertase Pin-like site-specific DNA recombinase